jgi:LPPG:FO 2-phospho-L-lactate transferase
MEVTPVAVARHYAGLLRAFVLDTVDAALAPRVEALGVRVLVTDTIMKSDSDRARLATDMLRFAASLPT